MLQLPAWKFSLRIQYTKLVGHFVRRRRNTDFAWCAITTFSFTWVFKNRYFQTRWLRWLGSKIDCILARTWMQIRISCVNCISGSEPHISKIKQKTCTQFATESRNCLPHMHGMPPPQKEHNFGEELELEARWGLRAFVCRKALRRSGVNRNIRRLLFFCPRPVETLKRRTKVKTIRVISILALNMWGTEVGQARNN